MFDESVESTVKVIVEKSFKRVALQFPDSLLEHSPRVVRALQDRLKDDVELFVLGDTQFGDRFVDEVAAQRAQADFLVHYGDAHVGPTESLPVQYVFGNQELKSLKCFPDTLKRKRVLLFTSWKYYNTCEQIGNMLRENGFEHVIVARPELNRDNMWVQRNRNEMDEVDTVVIENTPRQTELSSSSCSKPIKTEQSYNRDVFVQDENVDVFAMIGGDVSTSSSEEEEEEEEEGEEEEEEEEKVATKASPTSSSITTVRLPRTYRLGGVMFTLPKGHAATFRDSYACLYVGKDTRHLMELRTRLCDDNEYWWSYDVETETLSRRPESEIRDAKKRLGKRYNDVQRLRDAKVIGLVVGTLAERGYLERLNRMRTECRKAGKKTYTFLVGKVNTPKLANFLVVDAYVMLAGTERVEEVVERDGGKFPKAVCGVYELEIALGLRSWDGRLGATTTNLRKEEEEKKKKVESSHTTIDKNIVSDTQLMNLGSRELSVWVSEAAETLNNRDWKGLEKRNEEEEEFARVSTGRDGVASMYKREDDE